MKNSLSAVQRAIKSPPSGSSRVKLTASTNAYADPIKLFRKTFKNIRTQADRDFLLHVVLEACQSAKNYIASDLDENKKFRDNDAAARRVLRDQNNAILTLSSFAREHDRQSGFALALAGFRGRGE